MRVLSTARTIGRLSPSPAPALGARLLQRRWLFGGKGENNGDLTFALDIPDGARWGVARAVAAGGLAVINPEDTSVAWFGAGGCYARSAFPARRGQSLAVVVGGQGSQSVRPPGATTVAIDGVAICRAAKGPDAALGGHGAAPNASDCIGDVIRPGGAGGTTALHGGLAGGDLFDADSLRLGGVRRQPAHLAKPLEVADQFNVLDYGAGGVAGVNGAPGNEWWPETPSGGNHQFGGPGVCVLEFYDRRPY